MNSRFSILVALLSGLTSAQLIATLHVRLSNHSLFQNLGAAIQHGYLAVPAKQAFVFLNSWEAAIVGGMFFTFTTGAGLTILTIVFICCRDRLFQFRRAFISIGLIAWAALLFFVNPNGLNLPASLYVIGVPSVTFATMRWLSKNTPPAAPTRIRYPLISVGISVVVWGCVLDANIFTHIRDHLLLTTPPGRVMVDVYYRFTLYPAAASQPLAERQIRTCTVDEKISENRVSDVLRGYDYLPLSPGIPADLDIEWNEKASELVFKSRRKTVMAVSLKDFLKDPAGALNHYSEAVDQNKGFRRLTLAGLLVGFPLMLFIFLFHLIRIFTDRMLPPPGSDITAAAGCAMIGVLLLIPVFQGRQAAMPPPSPAATPTRYVRIAALRRACEENQGLTTSVLHLNRIDRADIAERYWLARSLACVPQPGAISLVRKLADDPSPIVACQSLRAMGLQGDRALIPYLLNRIQTDSHGYVQVYAYRALKELGWVQPSPPPHAF